MDETPCAANWATGQPPCTRQGEHHANCPGKCEGCLPRLAVDGYLCGRHLGHLEQAGRDLTRLRALLAVIGNGRAVQADSSSSNHAGPRVPLSALRLDLDELTRTPRGDHRDFDGVMVALEWARTVHAAARRHPTEPKRERLHRVRCAGCQQVSVIVDPPAIAGGDSTLRCVSCGWQTRDQDHAEAAAYTEAVTRDPYRPRRRAAARQQPAGLERLAGVARLAAALR